MAPIRTLVAIPALAPPRARARGGASQPGDDVETILQLYDVLRNLDQYLNHVANANLLLFYVIVFAIVFAETGLVVTPFLPGDSLLFALGALAATAGSALSMPLLLGLLVTAAVLGDAVNYSIGHRVGPAVFR